MPTSRDSRVRTVLFSMVLTLAAASFAAPASEAALTEGMADFRQVISAAKEKVFPAVVFLMPIAERFDGGKKEKTQVAGSGVIVSADGEVVTNWHVVDKAVEIRCLLYDGTARRASIVGVDKDTDLALLRLESAPGDVFPAAALGDSAKLEEGQFVIAMGAPWGLSRSVSLGILSCVNRFLSDQGGGYNLWLQTDASINPGNSGGPLVNTEGKVIGINSLGSMMGGNLAFAIPSNTVAEVAAALRKNGRVVRSWTGLSLQPLKDFERNIFYDGDSGVLVAGVAPDSPAASAGVKVGDLLMAVDGETIRGINHEDIPPINQRLAELPIGGGVVLRIASGRGGLAGRETREVKIVPEEKGRVEGSDFDCRQWNMTVKSINEFATPMLYFFKNRGVYVQAVKYPGNAANSGLQAGDIIVELDGAPVEDLDDCRRIYESVVGDAARGEKKVVVTVMRAGLKNYLVLDYAAKYGQD